VSPGNLRPAIALNGVSYNLSRAIGPALGGLLLTYGKIQSVFLFNTITFFVLIGILYRWRNKEIMPPPQSFGKAYREGLVAVLHSRNFLKLIVRTIAFTAFVSVIFSLVPHLSKYEWHQTTTQYTLLWVSLGAGALCGSLFYGRMIRLLRSYQLVAMSCIGVGTAMIVLALTHTNAWHFGLLFVLGFGWIWSTSTLNVLAQLYSPKALRARFLAVNITIFQGSLALTSLFWGYVSNAIGSIATFGIAGGVMAAASAILIFFPMEEPAAAPDEKVACTALILIPATQTGDTAYAT
jgi:predicted MFS family arabinose efflux permease